MSNPWPKAKRNARHIKKLKAFYRLRPDPKPPFEEWLAALDKQEKTE